MIFKHITRVEHKVKRTRTEEVERTVTETYQECVKVIKSRPVTRTRTIKHGPAGCGVCLRCSVSLKDDMWKYRKADQCYLCPSCWYELDDGGRKIYRKKAEIGYLSTENYQDTEYYEVDELQTKTRKKKIKESVAKEYYETDRIIEFPHHTRNIPYPNENNVVTNRIDLSDLINQKGKCKYYTFEELNDEEIGKDMYWYGARSIGNAYKFIRENNKVHDFDYSYLDTIEINDNSFDTEQKLEEFLDVVGFYPNVPAYLQGMPLNMYNNKRYNEVSTTVFCNLALDSICTTDQYENRGKIVNGLLWYLIDTMGVKVNLMLLDATFIKGQTFIQQIRVPYQYIVENKIIVYNALVSAAFYRVLLLNIKRNMIRKGELSDNWNVENGYGYVMRRKDLFIWLESKRVFAHIEPILFSDPIEDHIAGQDIADDLVASTQCAIPQNLRPKKRSKPEFPIDIDGLKGFVEEHNIEKLIHVTNLDNLDSIRKNGILTNSMLKTNKIPHRFNDSCREDENAADTLCLYVTAPNKGAFQRFNRQQGKKQKFVILEIKPDILWRMKDGKPIRRQYSSVYATSAYSVCSENDISVMFKDYIRIGYQQYKERTANMLSSLPTSQRAEILFYDKIPVNYIMNMDNPEPLSLSGSSTNP